MILYSRAHGTRIICRTIITNSRNRQDSLEWPYPIYVSERATDRKSVFLAHASALQAASEFPKFLSYLNALPILKRATHCMYAYRIKHPDSRELQLGQHDGGESGSGDRLARLLELSNCENAIVVVSRWYGGVKLGSDRWKRISEVAKDVLKQGEFSQPKASEQTEGGRNKRR
ncbi:ribosomal protein S5 domain 2-like protein [Pluteus cervinus]|uniref:Ribosomal protein S5 domain 2-like protein n=1 Tax=Pluteus cervinus TaxID=181527 RepID=A0ACD3BCW5_9AGAR|nr:ribosomal protein S5 domain 2-like protein [Pluteus cervinus]